MLDIESLTDKQKLGIVLLGLDGVMTETAYYKKCYEAYKKGVLEDVSEEILEEMKILELLENLGYPMAETGTYLYKDVVAKAARHLKTVSTRSEVLACKELITAMKTRNSQFYFDIARNDLDMGLNSFHQSVQNALLQVDYSKADPTLLIKIYSGLTEDMDYGEHAFVIASYAVGILKPKTPEAPKVKMLEGSSPEIGLKAMF